MTNTNIPCRAKDPTKCPYHGAELRAEAALAKGDFTAYAKAQEDMAKATKTTPEIKSFFKKKAVEVEEDTTVPTITEKKILQILTSAHKGRHLEARAALATKISSILNEPNVGMHPQHEKHEKIVATIKEVWGQNTNYISAANQIFLHNGYPVTRTATWETRIVDERNAQEVTVKGDQLKIGDIFIMDNNRYEITETRDRATEKKPNIIDTNHSVLLMNTTVDRKPYRARVLEWATRPHTDYKILQ